MKEVLLNLANIHLINLCKEKGVDCSGTHVEKMGRGFTYILVNEGGKPVAVVRFSKNTVPYSFIY